MFNSENGMGYQFGSSGLMPLDMGDDDEFLALLQSNLKQPVSATYNMSGNNTGAPATANPADLTVLRTISSPNTESSGSPSPPSASANGPTSAINPDLDHDGGLLQTPISAQSATFNDSIWSNHQRQMSSSASRSTRSAVAARDDGGATKRKILDDLDEESSDDDAPQRKVQHTDANGSKKSGTKRKSGSQDDNRLLKRKEQNRAAQRAFRERKERHVKDLEDQVLVLEAKTDTQAAENENLRELLTRLQQENLQLKQNQFRFTFQQPLASTSNASYQPQQNPTPDSLAAPSSSTPSSNNHSPFSDDPLKLLVSSGANNNNNVSQPQLVNTASPPDLNLLETLGVGASNPANEYRNLGFGSPMPFSPMDNNPNINNNTPPLSDMFTPLGDLSSFPPLPYQTIAANPMYTSFRDPNPNAWASFGPNPSNSSMSYDELFGGGGAVSNLPSTGLNRGSFDELMPFSFLPDLSNGSQISGLSPISHLATPPTAQAGQSSSSSGQPVTTPASDQQHDANMIDVDEGKKCPKSKEEMAVIIDSAGPSTFGPPIEETLQAGQVCDKMAMADTTKLNLDIGTAWRAVRQHPQFEECDIDELCAELAKKAKCDGNTKVIEAQKIMDLVHSIPERAKQRKASIANLANSNTRAV